MGEAAVAPFIPYDAYRALEQTTGQKHEWFDGRVYAMAGGTLAHGALAVAVASELRALALACGCQVFSSDVKVRVTATGLATYPDGSVVCAEVATDPEDAHVITNPALLVEVLSESTEGYDRGEKFAHYQQMPSLRDYVLVSQHTRRVEVFSRDGVNQWTLRVAGAGQSVPLTALGGVIEVDRVYAGITLSPAPLRVVTRA
jgi:Uma2 family endonuclease